ncbi:MAG TPA: adenylate/guanylate cyclase domain-containing protein [Treponemataceae bacterium]|nr:adenylate/guanylate cyclase domain-containing protein [Treponemataceae bacterium]
MEEKVWEPKIYAREADLLESIEKFYLPKHLVKAIFEIGHIPSNSQESQVGVGFIDIADYTHLSKFLSPKENQILLNGLYTAFQMVLERHGGFLNKIEGDSMMFQFDDVIDKRLWDLDHRGRIKYIAKELFYTCVEMQRVCILFNQANVEFIDENALPEAKKSLTDAFAIIQSLRSKNDLSSTLFAFFQIRIRIGANIGEVTIGNFGPIGSKHWDIIGLPVINAKRMEATAPVGGLRISEEFFDILMETGIAEDYLHEFRREAERLGSVYKRITHSELYKFREVVVQDKRNATYKTYSVQVYPALPESISQQSEALLLHDVQGARQIIEFFRYYRGNHYVIDSLETMLESKGINFRKEELFSLIAPKQAENWPQGQKISLFMILNYLDRYMDQIHNARDECETPDFLSYDQFMSTIRTNIQEAYEQKRTQIVKRTYYTDVVIHLVYTSMEAAIREYQVRLEEPAVADSAEEIDEAEEAEEVENA